ncbi:hypothetical protein B5X24_HaOG211004 [Helicoverpa armigera]|nr:hypothetical protein B5X24_HaOG211004 [Helicoverpa armigera]
MDLPPINEPSSSKTEGDFDLIETEGVILSEDVPTQISSPIREPETRDNESNEHALEGEYDTATNDEAVSGDHVQDASEADQAEEFIDAQEEIEPEVHRYNLRDRSTLRPPQRMKDYIGLIDSDYFGKDALGREARDEWLKGSFQTSARGFATKDWDALGNQILLIN